jgi:Arc/MetJ-type ribon-helix-helix transcriptional regulator
MSKDKDPSYEPNPELTLREDLLSRLMPEELEPQKRDVSVMTRLSTNLVEILNALVKLGLFKSKSEIIASVIERTFLPHLDLFEEIKEQAKKQDELQDAAKELALQALRGER